MPELDARVGGRKLPVDRGLLRVATGCPGGDFGGQEVAVGDAPTQALSGEDAQLNLGDIQPVAVLGRLVQLQISPQPPGFVRREGFVQRRADMGIEVVEHQHHPLRLRIVVVH